MLREGIADHFNSNTSNFSHESNILDYSSAPPTTYINLSKNS
jgi:hypothetical protein